jgi:hypothetical protein
MRLYDTANLVPRRSACAKTFDAIGTRCGAAGTRETRRRRAFRVIDIKLYPANPLRVSGINS